MSNSVLTFSNFFSFFIYNPTSDFLNDDEKQQVEKYRRYLGIFLKPIAYLCELYNSELPPQYYIKTWYYREQRQPQTEIQKRMQERVKELATSFKKPEKNEDREARKVNAHQIINNLYLGNATAFVETTELEYKTHNARCEVTSTKGTNPLGVNTVITVCPTSVITSNMSADYSFEYTNSEIEESFKKHEIKWLDIGRTALDQADGWTNIVHDATFPDSPEAKLELAALQESDVEKKKKKLDLVDFNEFFEPVFQEIDKAVFHKKVVLIHCQEGISRSSSIVAAYLINRFLFTTEEAVMFLQSKRPCVNTKFEEGLKQYSEDYENYFHPDYDRYSTKHPHMQTRLKVAREYVTQN